jgi:replicative DNA helicase
MKLSTPIYHLKRNARQMARTEAIPLHEALDRIAATEGYSGWSLLAARYAARSPVSRLYSGLRAGDLVLVGARPGQGKTLMALELAVEAVKVDRPSFVFTLDYTEQEVLSRLETLDLEPDQLGTRLMLDCSDGICAAHIIERLRDAQRDTLVVIDYLQLLDQKREHPPLADQVSALKAFAQARGLVMVFISQIDRSFDAAGKSVPDLDDVRLPNPLDLALFDKTCFLNNGEVRLNAAA